MSRRTIAVVVVVVVVGVLIGRLAWYYVAPAPFMMQVTSRPKNPTGTEKNIVSLVGQIWVFLVVVEDEGGWMEGGVGLGEAVDISATDLGGMADVTVYPRSITPGQFAEVTVIPDAASTNETLTITISGERRGLIQTETVNIEVVQGEDLLGPSAVEMRDLFIPWLAKDHPELGITNETEWTGAIVNPVLIVMHYIFFSDEWEMYLTWHVTIPPDDWTRIYLRHRFNELTPSHAFEISSVTAQGEPHAIEVPDWV